ncbi:uncharacterized protein LOC120477357 [Pimephales promelas]|uniref:uncharacterized protein LOC120477357 n=1 Tax=Pimephales promelas TaxID=90988 RepID=UPI0019556C24|nr:uncharacterized protein LOC120477357 [Pimephales promelas]
MAFVHATTEQSGTEHDDVTMSPNWHQSQVVFVFTQEVFFWQFPGAVGRTRAETNVQADVDLVFSEKSTEPIPSATSIVETLKEAATAPSFNLTIDPTTVTVIKSLQIIPVTIVTNGTFVAALSNTSSTEYQDRATMIKLGLEPFFFVDYPSFRILTLTNFSNASVKTRSVPTIRNSMDLAFGANGALPNSTQIVNTIVKAARKNSIAFQIFTSEIVINGTVFSSAEVSSRISVLTAVLLVAAALLLSRFD